jgi:5-methylthioadenosine/S-adenosylhomocysteine deaminase
MKGTIILPAWLISVPSEEPLREWGVRVEADKITDVAPNDQLYKKYPGDQVWNASDEVLSPGFVNGHTHLYGVLAHGIPLSKAPSGFWPFLEDFWWPLVENQLDHDMICAATDLRCANMLESGVTSFYDCTEAPNALPGCLEAQAEVVLRHGLRGILSFEATERLSRENGELGLQENASFIKSMQQKGGLVSGFMCHHTTFTCSDEFIRKAFKLAQEAGVLLHAHVSEGTYEPEFNLQKHGKRTLHYYKDLGLANSSFLASQCVQIDESEIQLMAETGIRMTHMPLSNCEVGGGIAPLPQLVEAGVSVGLGSDGYIDDFFEVMRGAFLIHKAKNQDPRVMPANLVWRLATEGGAKVLGLEKVGRLEPGWQADLVLIDSHLPTPLEEHNLYDQLLLYRNSRNVSSVMIAGRVRVRNGEVLGVDWDALNAHAHEAAQKLWAKAK